MYIFSSELHYIVQFANNEFSSSSSSLSRLIASSYAPKRSYITTQRQDRLTMSSTVFSGRFPAKFSAFKPQFLAQMSLVFCYSITALAKRKPRFSTAERMLSIATQASWKTDWSIGSTVPCKSIKQTSRLNFSSFSIFYIYLLLFFRLYFSNHRRR